MRRRRRPYQKSLFDYLLPFIVIMAGLIVIYYIIKSFFGGGNSLFADTKVVFYIENGKGEVKIESLNEWLPSLNTSTGAQINQGESVRTDFDSRAKLLFNDKSIVRLDEKTVVDIVSLNDSDDTKNQVLNLEQGRIWAKISYVNSRYGGTKITTPMYELDTRGGVFTLDEDSVSVIEGECEFVIIDNGEIIKSVQIGIGQEVNVSLDLIEKIKRGDSVRILSAYSDELKESEWYLWNKMKDEKTFTYDDKDKDGDTSKEEVNNEGDKEDSMIDEGNGEEINNDIKAMEPPAIIQPRLNANDEVETKEPRIIIKGSIGKDVDQVYVNDYKLQKYVTGSGEWEYIASTVLGNLKEGENKYTVYGEDTKDKKTEEKVFYINYKKDPTSKTDEPEEIKDTSNKDRTDNTKLAITSHTNEEKVSADNFILKGTASRLTSYIIVNGYRLQNYQPGDKDWIYKVNTSYDNLKSGKNTYNVVAYNEKDKEIEAISINIIYEPKDTNTGEKENKDTKEENNKEEPNKEDNNITDKKITTPIVLYPTKDTVYATSLETIALGGTCSPITNKIFINNASIQHNYGETKWNKTVNLREGENKFRIYAEDKDGNMTKSVSITINYKK